MSRAQSQRGAGSARCCDRIADTSTSDTTMATTEMPIATSAVAVLKLDCFDSLNALPSP